MMIKVTFVKNKSFRRFFEHIFYLLIVLVLIPSFFFFELCIVLPTIAEEGTLEYFLHMFFATYLLLNILGNMIYGMFTDTSIKRKGLNIERSANKQDWTNCSICECQRPPRAWHCDFCNICILKRDHHCTFFACCVGYYNQRYFLMFTFHIFVGMMYAFYYNIIFSAQNLSWSQGLIILKVLFPFASIFVDFGSESLYILLIVINFIVGLFTGFLFFYHLINVLNGQIVPETKLSAKQNTYDKGWLLNLEEVLGLRWYLTWLSPFVHSPLPGKGLEWTVDDKNKLI